MHPLSKAGFGAISKTSVAMMVAGTVLLGAGVAGAGTGKPVPGLGEDTPSARRIKKDIVTLAKKALARQ